ncbi:MAG: universal stress protein [Magnetococcales bacterium]|nr:universal stress protein [Magnetococcales bacterium]
MNSENSAEKKFGILVCVDGSDESYKGLTYAVRMSQGLKTDITLLYVRAFDRGKSSEGIQVDVARENMLAWGLDLPGVRYLQKGRELLIEQGHMAMDWQTRTTHQTVVGDPVGDQVLEYSNDIGSRIRLRLKLAKNIETGILDVQEEEGQEVIIVGGSGRKSTMAKFLGINPVALRVAMSAPCSVIVARKLEMGKGHLICTTGSKNSVEMVRKDAVMADRCDCPITLLSVAHTEETRALAQQAVDDAIAVLTEMNISIHGSSVVVGNPISEIIEAGKSHSIIVMSATNLSSASRFFIGVTSLKVLEQAETSVMIVR